MRPLSDHAWVFTAIALIIVLVYGQKTAAKEKETPVLLDGISVIAGGQASKESDGSPLLLSDIEFEARMILVSRFGPSGLIKRISQTLWLEARRRATLIHLLAVQARQLRETVTALEKKFILKEILEQMGGKKATDDFLARLGLGRDALNNWIENAALALTQIGYVEEQVEMPSNREIENKMREETMGKDFVPENIREKYREMVMKEKTDEQIRRWLVDLSSKGSIRVVR